MLNIPTARDLQARIAQIEGEKTSAILKAHEAAEAEKKAFIERLSRPSGLTDEQIVESASHAAQVIRRAVENGQTSVQLLRFPNHLCTDNGRAIDEAEAGWEKTLTGIPRELYQFYERQLRPRGYRIKYEIVDRPGGIRGDVGVFLSWA